MPNARVICDQAHPPSSPAAATATAKGGLIHREGPAFLVLEASAGAPSCARSFGHSGSMLSTGDGREPRVQARMCALYRRLPGHGEVLPGGAERRTSGPSRDVGHTRVPGQARGPGPRVAALVFESGKIVV